MTVAEERIQAIRDALNSRYREADPITVESLIVDALQAVLDDSGGGGGGAPEWQSYTPVWEISGDDAWIGDGTVSGAYVRWGDTVTFCASFEYGTTTAPGAGSAALLVSVPVAPDAAWIQGPIVGTLVIRQASAIDPGLCVGLTSINEFALMDNNGSPFTQDFFGGDFYDFQPGDAIHLAGTYRAAP